MTIERFDVEVPLRRFVAARDGGDAAGARAAWKEIVELEADRVRGFVTTWRGGRLTADEREEAVQRALIKAWRNMVHTFRGASVGELRAALRRCAEFACLSVHREGAQRMRREPSLDEQAAGADEPGAPGRHDVAYARAAERAFTSERERAEARDAVAAALAAVAHERQRLVMERTLDGVPVPEIARELATSEQNVHQLRSRALKAMRAAMEDPR